MSSLSRNALDWAITLMEVGGYAHGSSGIKSGCPVITESFRSDQAERPGIFSQIKRDY